MKRAFIVHGWGGYPEEGWFPWLKEELSSRGFEAVVLSMPNPENPTIKKWVDFLSRKIGKPDEDTYLIGHSIGCQTIMRYLEKINARIGGALLVAAWFDLENLETDEEKEVAKPWLETPIEITAVKKNAGEIVTIISDNDPFGAFETNKKRFAELGKVIVKKGEKHFCGADGITELPAALEEICRMAGVSSQNITGGKYIELNVFLKIKGFAATGGQAKIIIREGKVKVNGEVETRNKRKLHEGDKVSIEGKMFVVEKDVVKKV